LMNAVELRIISPTKNITIPNIVRTMMVPLFRKLFGPAGIGAGL